MKKGIWTIIGAFFWVIAILLSLFAVFKIVPTIELSVGFIAISFSILAIIWTNIARDSLSSGSSLRKYVTSFLVALVFLFLFSVWETSSKIFEWHGLIVVPKYVFSIIAYVIFAVAAYQIWHIGKVFGFKHEAKKIRKLIKEKNQKSKK